MKNLTSYLFLFFMIMFWVFRIIVALCASMSFDFVVQPMDLNFEIILLFLTLVSIILIFKRSMLGALFYLIGNGLYFGTDIYNAVMQIMDGGEIAVEAYPNLFFSGIGILLPILVLFDMLLDKGRKVHPVDKKTDWFYKNKEFDRQFDERADRNEYKF